MGKKLRFNDNGHLANSNSRLANHLFKPIKLFAGPKAKTENQQRYLDAIEDNDIVFAIGPSGSGKTHLAVGMAVQGLKDEEFNKIIAIRPCLGVGRPMGYLPGEIEDKVAPYLRPILDELRKFFTYDEIERMRKADVLELGSIEHIRGRTIEDSIIILDEAQNCTREELKVVLTRLGMGSKMVVNGDITRDKEGRYTQCDLPTQPNEIGAFEYQCQNLGDLDGVAVVGLTEIDVVRHPLVRKMIKRGL